MKFRLKKFDVRSIRDDAIVCMVGKRGTGKSFLTRDIMYHKQDMPAGMVISGTEKVNAYFSHFVPPIVIHDEYQESIIEDFLKRQQSLKVRKLNGETDIDSRAFLIFDDCMYDETWKRSKAVRRIFMNGRHSDIFFILTMQYPLGVPPNLRGNIDYSFILRENILGNRRRIYDNYAGVFQTFEIFCSVMDQCTENNECLVIKNCSDSNKLEDQVFWYRAETHGDFRVCTKELWDYSERMCKNDEEDDGEENLNDFKPKKSIRLNVKKV